MSLASDHPLWLYYPASDDPAQRAVMRDTFQRALDTLLPREREAVSWKLGLHNGKPGWLSELAAESGMAPSTVFSDWRSGQAKIAAYLKGEAPAVAEGSGSTIARIRQMAARKRKSAEVQRVEPRQERGQER